MKIRLRVSEENVSQLTRELEALGIEIDEASELTLTDYETSLNHLVCWDGEDMIIVKLSEVIYIESVGKDVYVNTMDKRYKVKQRLYNLEMLLPQDDFIRISNGVIIERGAIERIRPALSCRFYLTLKNGAKVDVTRSYYYKFKDFYGI